MDILINFIQSTGHILINNIIPLIVVLGFMIFIHELGHFLVAKYFNVKVLKFALGFGPKIVSKEYGETEYSIRYLPLGGFVKMLGEDDFDEDAEPVEEKDINRAFSNQHPLKRMAIVSAGPVFNLLLAFVLFFGLYMVSGNNIRVPEVGKLIDGAPAQEAGLMTGDIIVAVGEEKIEKFEDVRAAIEDKAGIPVIITVNRYNEFLSFSLVPEVDIRKNEFGEEVKTARIGFYDAGKTRNIKLNPVDAFKEALSYTWYWVKQTCLVVIKLFDGTVSIKTVGGPIMIGQMTGQIVQESIGYLIPFMAIISINLGILNLLPVPILDGGVVFFLLLELVIGRPLSIKKREIAMKIGLSLLLLLMAVVFYNDILRLVTG